jgi:hypothetical protein
MKQSVVRPYQQDVSISRLVVKENLTYSHTSINEGVETDVSIVTTLLARKPKDQGSIRCRAKEFGLIRIPRSLLEPRRHLPIVFRRFLPQD